LRYQWDHAVERAHIGGLRHDARRRGVERRLKAQRNHRCLANQRLGQTAWITAAHADRAGVFVNFVADGAVVSGGGQLTAGNHQNAVGEALHLMKHVG
jgi:hypothetical protein